MATLKEMVDNGNISIEYKTPKCTYCDNGFNYSRSQDGETALCKCGHTSEEVERLGFLKEELWCPKFK